ncbi:MAG: hypothetical protein H0X66_00790 [Verrucomicrobia bacterium]|nr:hypothetical protein [Verrucomicrobiota bacterium]
MIILSPEEARDAIRRGDMCGPVRVKGRLDLTELQQESLPPGLHCYELDATKSQIKNLPADLRIDGRLVLDNCQSLASLPEGLTAGSISLRDCPSLRALPEGLSTWFLDMTACSHFEMWPTRGTIHHGALILRNCIGIRSLPTWIGRLAQLNVAGCTQLGEIPDGIAVSSWVDVGGSGITGLPPSLQGAPLRWRGVRVDERIAFHPEELTAKEALAEKNAELRRVIIERMGYLRFAAEAGAKVIDEDQDRGGARQLLRIELREDEPLVGLSCHCPSTGRQYFLRVPPKMKTCHQAAAWMAGYDDPSLYRPQIET